MNDIRRQAREELRREERRHKVNAAKAELRRRQREGRWGGSALVTELRRRVFGL